jgi:hypothetical protein
VYAQRVSDLPIFIETDLNSLQINNPKEKFNNANLTQAITRAVLTLRAGPDVCGGLGC